jgi:hypothetical protein
MTQKTLMKGAALVVIAALALTVCSKAEAQTGGNPLVNTSWRLDYGDSEFMRHSTILSFGATDLIMTNITVYKTGSIIFDRNANGGLVPRKDRNGRTVTREKDETVTEPNKFPYSVTGVSGEKITIAIKDEESGEEMSMVFTLRGNTMELETGEGSAIYTKVQ